MACGLDRCDVPHTMADELTAYIGRNGLHCLLLCSSCMGRTGRKSTYAMGIVKEEFTPLHIQLMDYGVAV